MNSCGDKHSASVSKITNQKKHKPQVKKPKKVRSKEILASPKPSKPRICLRWPPTGRMFDLKGKIIASSESMCQSGSSRDLGCSKHMTGNLKLLINFVWRFLGIVRFGNDHIAAILGYDDLQWGNILITRAYFVEGLGHNLFSAGQFCDSDLEALCYPKHDREDIGKLGAKATPRTNLAAPAPQVLQTSTASTTTSDTPPTPTNSSPQATVIPITS
uniref:Integrase, catalytic region, zinc finger, CCHC-type, peptidase aspartic, catalytic n=1 Tax=Tanacetum cinerariifolium TaxID=118510 RepID=A0A699IXQ5_TANCI|nr:integrase, catalytic region, zinc finger, CCHC-type, peptidase aspartic, catalytic [Tanacetum cinerariifolium]